MNTKGNAIIGIAFGLGAALSYGSSAVLVRYGVDNLAAPLVGAAIALFSGTLGLSILGVRGVRANLAENRRGIVFLVLSGVAAASGIISSFFALSMAPVVIIVPLQSTSSLFALLWSYLFLSRLERITPRLVLGSVLVVSGVILIAISRTA